MSIKFNGTTVTAVNLVKDGAVTPLTKVIFNGTTVFSGSTPPGTLYYWKRYNVDEVTRTWYTEGDFGTATATGLSNITGGYAYSFNSDTGTYTAEGSATVFTSSVDGDEVYVASGSTLIRYFVSGGVIYSESKGSTQHTGTTQEKGSYIGEVSSANANAYPTDGIAADGFWYTFDRSE